MPLLPQKPESCSSDLKDTSDSEVKVDKANVEEKEMNGAGYKGLLDNEDEDDKMWNNFNSTIEAVGQP